jgi:hypothetical protein
MARPSIQLVLALRETALRLSAPSVRYEWSHFGHCNCGHLAQTLTGLSPKLIYDAAFQRSGDWGEQVKELAHADLGDRPALDEGALEPAYEELCSATGSPLSGIFAIMRQAGLSAVDIGHLEDLSDGDVLRRMGKSQTGLERNQRENVIAYLEAWADHLTSKLTRDELRKLQEWSGDQASPLLLAAE